VTEQIGLGDRERMAGLSPNNVSPVGNFKDFQEEHVPF